MVLKPGRGTAYGALYWKSGQKRRAAWNDFFGPLIYLHSHKLYTLSLGLRSFQDQNYTEWHLLMAASLVAMSPVLLIFFFAQKYFIQGIVFTGIKG